ncbi:hypothetical protein B0H19DRAFT_1284837 [Mycena capillaripes]|nr:hypothetical protein B0H19DRAFT_1284837 [Mycena capillaripes]
MQKSGSLRPLPYGRYRLEQILTVAIPYSLWQRSDGVIAEVNQNNKRESAQTTGDLNLVQGLATAYAWNATSIEMHAYIGHYLAIQFNAVVDLATVGGTNIYGGSWVGPPSPTHLGQDQTTALSALIGALVVSHDSTPSSSVPATTSPAAHPRKAKSVPIAFGVVGSVLFLLAVLGIWIHTRRSAARRSDPTQLLPISGSSQMRRYSPRFLTGKFSQQRPAPSLSNQQAVGNPQHSSYGLPVRISTVTTHPQNQEIWAEGPPPDYEGMSELHGQTNVR